MSLGTYPDVPHTSRKWQLAKLFPPEDNDIGGSLGLDLLGGAAAQVDPQKSTYFASAGLGFGGLGENLKFFRTGSQHFQPELGLIILQKNRRLIPPLPTRLPKWLVNTHLSCFSIVREMGQYG